MADDVEVKFSGDYGEMTGGAQDAAASIQSSLSKIADALQNFNTQHKSVSQAAVANNATLSRSFVELRASATQGFNGIVGVIERFKGTLASLTTIIAGGYLWSEAINHLKEFNGEVTQLENVLGIASDKATELAIALKIGGSSAEIYTGVALKMARQLKQNEDEFGRNSVAVRDNTGAFLPLDTVMQNAFTRMGQLKAGTDQAEFALQFFGRSVQDVYQLMVVLPAAQERAKQLMQDMNVEFGPDRQAAVRQYQIEVGAFKEMLGVTADDIGIKVLPQLEALAKYFNEVGPSAAGVFMKVLTGMIVSIDHVVTGFKEWGVVVKAFWDLNALEADHGMTVWSAIITNNWAYVLDNWTRNEKKRLAITMAANAEILGMEVDLQKRMAILGGDNKPGKPGPGPLPHGNASFVSPLKGGAGGDDGAVMAGLENQLKAEQSAYNNMMLAQGSFQTWSIEQTRDYWDQALSINDLSYKDQQSIQNKFYEAERQVQKDAFNTTIATLLAQTAAYKYNYEAQIAIVQKARDTIIEKNQGETAESQALFKRILELRQQEADQELRIEDIKRKTVQATADFELQQQRTMLQQEVSLRQISVQQELALERQYVDQRYSIAIAGINREMADSADNPVKLAQLDQQKLAIEQQYQNDKTRIANQAELDRKQFAIQAANDVEAAFANTFSQLATSGQKWTDTLKQGVKSLADQLNQLFAQAIFKQLLGAGTQGGDFLNKIFGAAFGGGAADPAKAADTAAQTAHTTATTTDTTALTTNVAGLTTFDTGMTTTVGALATFDAAIASTQAALASFQAQLSAGGGGGGLGSLFGGGGGGLGGGDSGGDLFDLTGGLSGIAGFAVGTPYVPQDMIARVHKGEAIIPAKYNNGGNNTAVSQRNSFTYLLSGPVDMRTQMQINRRTIQAMRNTAKGGFA